MSRGKSWIKQRIQDPYLKKAHRENFRSRAAYKLEEIFTRFPFLRSAERILDLGSAPGSWSQMAQRLGVGKKYLLAVDIAPMDPIEGVEFHQLDIYSPEMETLLANQATAHPFDLILSDMAPHTTGRKEADAFHSAEMVDRALVLGFPYLKKGGHFIAKIFQGEETEPLRVRWRSHFSENRTFSPEASPKGSKELFLLFIRKK